MKLKSILAIFTLSVIVEGNLLYAAVFPVKLLAAVLSALDLDVEPIEWRNWLPFKKDDKKLGKLGVMTEEEI